MNDLFVARQAAGRQHQVAASSNHHTFGRRGQRPLRLPRLLGKGFSRDLLERVVLEECPLRLCIGLQPDTRAYLAGCDALGHLPVATQAGASDAHEQLQVWLR